MRGRAFGYDPSPNIELPDGSVIEGKEEIIIVGGGFRKDRAALHEIKRREALMWGRHRDIKKIVRGIGGRREKTRVTEGTMKQILIYGLDSFTMTAADEKKIDGIQTRVQKSMLNMLPAWVRKKYYEGDEETLAQVRDGGWELDSLTEWQRNDKHYAPWSMSVRRARVQHWGKTLKGDRLQPARRVLVDSDDRVFTDVGKPAQGTGNNSRPPWAAMIWNEVEQARPNPRRTDIIELPAAERLQWMANQAIYDRLDPVALWLQSTTGERTSARG